jgi:hypothetical protein
VSFCEKFWAAAEKQPHKRLAHKKMVKNQALFLFNMERFWIKL